MIKTNIKMRVTPEQSKKVQEICFSNGVYWYNIHNKDKVIVYSDYLYIDEYITHDSLNNLIHFKESINQEIDADYFIRTNGTCEEKYKTEYLAKYVNHTNKDSMPKDYDDALKKISNLRIALNKKVDKNKNQALEITKLLEQKKLLKKEISYKQNNDNGLRSLLKEAQEALDDLNKTIDLLEDRIKEKDTIISYLESKLK